MLPETLIVLVLVAAAEAAMSHSWFPPYYSIGVPLFHRVIRTSAPSSPPPSADDLRTALQSVGRPIAVAPLGDGVFAFREDSSQGTALRYSQLLHGSLAFNARDGTVTVTGLVNYFPVAFSTAIAALAWTTGAPWASPLPAVVLVPIYFFQRDVYISVAEAAARAWDFSTIPPAA